MYGKIFASMFKGSLYGQWEAIVTFTVMIVLADQHGEVDMTPESLSAQTSIPLDIIQRGIALLEAPDPKSRTPDEDGRRIVRVSDSREWGWVITNYAHYRGIRSLEERREYMRQYQRERRAKLNKVNQPSTPVNKVTEAVSSKQEVEGEEEATSAAPLGSVFSTPEALTAYIKLREASAVPTALDATLLSLVESPAGARVYGWPQIGQALHEFYLANGAVRLTAKRLRAFCEGLTSAPVAEGSAGSRERVLAIAQKILNKQAEVAS